LPVPNLLLGQNSLNKLLLTTEVLMFNRLTRPKGSFPAVSQQMPDKTPDHARNRLPKRLAKIVYLLPVAALVGGIHGAPASVMDASLSAGHNSAKEQSAAQQTPAHETIVLAGGCFWGMQAVFQHVKGVSQAVSGYAGGEAATAKYETVSTGTTGHAESVQVTFDPSKVTLGQLLQVYFSVSHNPTELNHQGPDSGTQYRSEIFFTTPEQEKIAKADIAQLDAAKVFSDPIVTKVEPLTGFYRAEDYHQNYATLHPDDPYITINDRPKVADLQRLFPGLYAAEPKLSK
jgi:peptide-methionine (S)-S-oxide reductase